MRLTTVMAGKEPAVLERDGEPAWPRAYADRGVSSWAFSDAVFSWDYDLIAHGSKARRHGLHEYVDSERMFTHVFDEMRARRINPPR